MLGAILKNCSYRFAASFGIAVQSLGKCSLRRQSLVPKSIIVRGNWLDRQTGIFQEWHATDLAEYLEYLRLKLNRFAARSAPLVPEKQVSR